MITVAILINGQPIMARSAASIGRHPEYDHWDRYQCDDGSVILHRPADGAVALAKKLLDTIKEV